MAQGRALVLGVNGQDGSYLAESLLARGWSVHGAGRQPESRWLGDARDFSYHALDLNDLGALSALLKTLRPGVIFHMAAVHGAAGFSYESHWQEAHSVNTLAAHAALEYLRCDAPDAVMIYASSSKAFGLTLPPMITESTPRSSTCIYSTTKNAATDLIGYYRQRHGIRASVVWTFNHESPRRGAEYFIPKIVTILANSILDPGFVGRIATLQFASDWGDAAEYMDIVADIAEKAPGNDFILASGTTWAARNFVEILFQRYQLRSEEHLIEQQVPPATCIANWHADPSALRNALGRTPQRSIFEVCDEILKCNHAEAWRQARTSA